MIKSPRPVCSKKKSLSLRLWLSLCLSLCLSLSPSHTITVCLSASIVILLLTHSLPLLTYTQGNMGHWVQARVVRTTVRLKHLWTSWIEVTPNNCNFYVKWHVYIIGLYSSLLPGSGGRAITSTPLCFTWPRLRYFDNFRHDWSKFCRAHSSSWQERHIDSVDLPTGPSFQFFQTRVSPDPSVISTHPFAVHLCIPERRILNGFGGLTTFSTVSAIRPHFSCFITFFFPPNFVVQYWLRKHQLTWEIDKTCALLL